MPRNETIISVFVASPGDVSEERDRLESIIEELNSTHARRTGVRLELLRWERDVSPAFGQDPQAVINDQIPQDYDIFIGILWNRIGSQTERAESGTVEEFELAKARYDKDPNSVRLMLYFKDAPPLTMDGFDPDQYKGVREFRSRVSEMGGFYGEFVTADDFSNSVRIDLTKVIYKLKKDAGDTDGEQPDSAEVYVHDYRGDETADELDDGILDLVEVFEEEMIALSAVLGRMSEAIGDIGESAGVRVQELKSLQIPDNASALSIPQKQQARNDAKRILKRAATDMSLFVGRMKPELPLFRQHLDRGIDVFTRAVPIHMELNEDRTELTGSIVTMLEGIDSAIVSMRGFHEAIQRLPRLTTAFVRSRRETEKVLQETIDIMGGGKGSLEGILSLLP